MGIQVYTIRNPNGLNTIQSPANMSDEWAPVFQNAIIDEYGAVANRPGYRQFAQQTPNGQPIETLMLYRMDDGTQIVLAAAGSNIYKQNQDGSWTSIKTGLNSAKFSYVNYHNYIVFFNGLDIPFYYNGTSCTTLTNIPSEWVSGNCPSVAQVHKDRIFVGGMPSKPKMLYYNALGKVNDWTTANDAGYIDLSGYSAKSHAITDIQAWDKFLIVFLDRETMVWMWDTPSTSYLERIIPSGAIYGKAQQFGNDLIFVDQYGVKTLTRAIRSGELNINPLSEMIENMIQEQISVSDDIATALFPYYRWVLFQWDDFLTCYDYARKAWYKFTNIDAKSFLTIGSDLYFSKSDGKMYVFDSDYYSDNGSAINFIFKTPWLYLGKLSSQKKPKFLKILLGENTLGNFTIKYLRGLSDYQPTILSKDIGIMPNTYWRSSYWRTAKWRNTSTREITLPLSGRADIFAFQFEHSDIFKKFSIVLNEIIFMSGGFR